VKGITGSSGAGKPCPWLRLHSPPTHLPTSAEGGPPQGRGSPCKRDPQAGLVSKAAGPQGTSFNGRVCFQKSTSPPPASQKYWREEEESRQEAQGQECPLHKAPFLRTCLRTRAQSAWRVRISFWIFFWLCPFLSKLQSSWEPSQLTQVKLGSIKERGLCTKVAQSSLPCQRLSVPFHYL
jgi:hypothetical protein